MRVRRATCGRQYNMTRHNALVGQNTCLSCIAMLQLNCASDYTQTKYSTYRCFIRLVKVCGIAANIILPLI